MGKIFGIKVKKDDENAGAAGQQKFENVSEFYQMLSGTCTEHELSDDRAYTYWSMEFYDTKNGLKGGGGLGILAADTRRVAEQTELQFAVVTPFYISENHQKIKDFEQDEFETKVSPEEFGFAEVGNINIRMRGASDAKITLYQKRLGSTRIITMSEPNFGLLYSGDGSGDHRLFQEVTLGFAGYHGLKQVGVKPAIMQLNEVATVFAAIARLDELCSNGMNFYEALVYVRKHSLYTNHTLVQAAESAFSLEQFESFVFPNLRSPAVKHWLASFFHDEERVKLSTITIEMCEHKNCVSKLHARVADYHDINGEKVHFEPVTNGIDMNEWVLPEIMGLFKMNRVVSSINEPSEDYLERVASLSVQDIRMLKSYGHEQMNKILANRSDQYGQSINIPTECKVIEFKRRFTGYKRPGMPFENPEILKKILLDHNAHYILSGKAHKGDVEMMKKLSGLLKMIDEDEVLKERVHYVVDYDEEVAKAMSFGADVSINVPIVGFEACGTSWEKDIANLVLMISTADGGVADVMPPTYFEVTGKDYEAEVKSLYHNLELALRVTENDEVFAQAIKRQLNAYLPTISGARMMKDYLELVF